MPLLQERASVSIETILFATDFSPASERAASYAKGLAQRFSSTVEIAHVFDPSAVITYEEAIMSLPCPERRQDSNEYLERLEKEFLKAGIKAHTVSPEGHRAAAAILKTAKEDDVDLIVSGTDSKRGIERILLGSTAEEILRSATCPVLTVGPNVKTLNAGPIVFRSIVFATDFSAEAAKAALFALSFAEDSGARLYFCHVLGAYPGPQSEAPIVDGMFQAALAKMIPESSYDWCSPECVLEHGEAAKGILSVADRVQADLIVLGPRKSSFLLEHVERGMTPSLLAKATCPVLTFC
jgi:nucleotide-binding universal stress UspA family protein